MKRNMIPVLILVLAMGGFLLARENIVLKVSVQTANVRSGPDAAAEVIAKVAAGTLLEASGKEGAWYKVTVNNHLGKAVDGFIHNSVVDVLSGGEEEVQKPRAAARREAPRPRVRKEFAAGGVKLAGGLSLGNLNFSEALPADMKKTSKMGFMGGVGFESGGRLALELDLLYSPGGAVLKSATDPTSKAKLTLSGAAITAPILLKVRFMPGTTPYILAGGEIGYILSQKAVATAADGTETEEDITDEINRLLYGIVFGGGVEMNSGGMNLLLELRYRLGLSNLFKEADPGTYARPTALSFLLGVRF